MITKEAKKKMGKKSRADGAKFELIVRKDMESKGWFVSKYTNNVEFDYEADKFYKVEKGTTGLLRPAKHKFNPFNKVMSMGTGFPDFICHKQIQIHPYGFVFDVIGVESKSNGILDKEEKEKCKWLLKNKVFSKILVASKIKTGRKTEITYKEFEW